MVDKKILFEIGSIACGADTNWHWSTTTLLQNDIQRQITCDKVDGNISLYSNAANKHYYVMVITTDLAGSWPGGISLEGCSDAQLQTFLEHYRNRVWMSLGGYIRYSANTPDEEGSPRLLELNAETKRALQDGQAIWLVVGVRNTSAAADTAYFVKDFVTFFH